MVRLLLHHDEVGLADVYTDKQYNVCQYEYMNGKVKKKHRRSACIVQP